MGEVVIKASSTNILCQRKPCSFQVYGHNRKKNAEGLKSGWQWDTVLETPGWLPPQILFNLKHIFIVFPKTQSSLLILILNAFLTMSFPLSIHYYHDSFNTLCTFLPCGQLASTFKVQTYSRIPNLQLISCEIVWTLMAPAAIAQKVKH